ncbi:MAG: response regulator [Flavobacteriaceae bacterium]|nr:response regulator [Flavobacteriaceae bacterium]
MNHQIRFYLLLIIFLKSIPSSSQQIKRVKTNNAIVNGTVNAFEKDSLGYIWIGTQQGLSRYSGVEFKKYSLQDNSDFEGKGVVDIINLKGELYLITSNGSLFQYSYVYDKFTKIFSVKNKQFLSVTNIGNYKLLIGLSSGLLIYDTASKTSAAIQHENIHLNRVVKYVNNTIYSGTSKGLYIFNYNEKTDKLNLKTQVLEEADIIDFSIDSANRLWVGTEINGLFVVDETKIIRKQLSLIKDKTYAIRKIQFDKKGKALVAVDRLGLFVLDDNLEIIDAYSHKVDDDNSISQNSIYEIFVDEHNAYWLGISEGGVNIVYENNNHFNNIFHIKNNSNSISNNSIRAIYESKNNELWFGTENGLSKLSNHSWINFNSSPKLYNTAVLSISSLDNNLLLGTYGEGLLNFDTDKNQVSKTAIAKEIDLKFIFHISSFSDELWIGGSDGPLFFVKDNKEVQKFPLGLERTVVEGYDQIVYVGSDSGFYEINKRNSSFRKINPEIFNINNEVFSLNFDKLNSCIWIACKNGLYKYNLSDEKLENITKQLKLEIGTVFSVKKDNTQNLYLAAISGLWKYDIRKKIFRKYGEEDGLLINEFGFGASAKLKDGSIAFGGPKGAVIFNPISLDKDEAIGDIFLSNFLVNGKKPDSVLLRKNINYTKSLSLNFDQNSLSFNFETVKFHGSKRNLFQWKLEGFDKEWHSMYGSSKIEYANLKPGDYNLIAKAFNADGVEGKNNYSLQLSIAKPFWKTWWAFSAYILLFFFISYLLYRITKSNIQKKLNEGKIKFFVEVAHDIRTPVSLIQLLVNQLSDQKKLNKTIELIRRNTTNLNEYVTQLLDFQKIDNNQLRLSISKVDLKDCFIAIINDFTPILEERSIDINLNVKHIPVWFDKVKMNRIFYNLISNAIKYSNDGSEIFISAFLNDAFLKITFKDQGIGIPEKQQEEIFNRFTRGTNVSNKGIPGTGIGLMLSKKIVELHGGKIILESKENIGSTFTVMLPAGTEHYNSTDIIQEEPETENSDKKLNTLIGKEKLILLVEDNDELRSLIKQELATEFSLVEAKNGKEGLLTALSKNPDIIITDIMMPIMDGKELCHLLKTNFKTSHIPVIMLTALADIDDKIKGLETGADAYVEKPFNINVLKATINNLIKSRENIKNILDKKEVKQELTPDERFLSDVIELIKENLTEGSFSIDTLCEKMGLSRSNLFRKLKGLIQMSPSDLIIKIKLNKSEELLKNKKNQRISDIAYESGFQDPKYFSTIFKKYYGKTPKEFAEEGY